MWVEVQEKGFDLRGRTSSQLHILTLPFNLRSNRLRTTGIVVLVVESCCISAALFAESCRGNTEQNIWSRWKRGESLGSALDITTRASGVKGSFRKVFVVRKYPRKYPSLFEGQIKRCGGQSSRNDGVRGEKGICKRKKEVDFNED